MTHSEAMAYWSVMVQLIPVVVLALVLAAADDAKRLHRGVPGLVRAGVALLIFGIIVTLSVSELVGLSFIAGRDVIPNEWMVQTPIVATVGGLIWMAGNPVGELLSRGFPSAFARLQVGPLRASRTRLKVGRLERVLRKDGRELRALHRELQEARREFEEEAVGAADEDAALLRDRFDHLQEKVDGSIARHVERLEALDVLRQTAADIDERALQRWRDHYLPPEA